MKIIIGDKDPWHLSPVPLLLVAAGMIGFVVGALLLTLGLSGWWWLLVASGGGLFALGARNMVREKRDMDAVLEKAADQDAGVG